MADKTAKTNELYFTVGVNLSDGRRFEAGAKVPADIKKSDLDAYKKQNVVETR